MKTHLKAELETVIQEWIHCNCESTEWPAVYVYDDLNVDMAAAAAAVFDANMKGQEFLEENT